MPTNPNAEFSFRRIIRDPETGEEIRDLFWERMGADSGDPEAMVQLAVAYLTGDGVEQSNEAAAQLMTMAAELDNPNAQYSLGMFYGQGCGVERDFDKVRYWMQRAMENGDCDALDILQNIEGAEAIRAAADAGDPEAQAKFAGILMSFHSPQNFRESLTYSRKAAEAGSLHGMYVLALAYQHGRGVEQSFEAAFHWYEKAAIAGYGPAQSNLACLYGRGDGVEQNQEIAMQWLQKAADQQDPTALRILGVDPTQEACPEADAECQAILEAVEAGDPAAMKEYAMACLQEFDWVEHIPEYGIELLLELGRQGDMEAFALVGLAYENGIGIDRDIEEAARWYERAARSGDPEMELALAKVCLQELDGRELDIEKCLRYAKSAAEKGHPEAEALYSFVSCTQALKRKGILTGLETPEEMMGKIQQAAAEGDPDAKQLFG